VEDILKIKRGVRDIFESQRLGVLATRHKGHPYTSLMAFVADTEMEHLIIATNRSTRKYNNILSDTRVAFMVDNRSNDVADFTDATAVTVIGTVCELEKKAREIALSSYLAKHPHLESFVMSPNCALLQIDMERLVVVTKFQTVVELHVT